jgi:Mn-dependent DtxR family transcriptional regulator
MKGLGYRQRAILALMETSPSVRTGYLVRRLDCDPRTVHVALLGLARRGLVVHAARGRWVVAA